MTVIQNNGTLYISFVNISFLNTWRFQVSTRWQPFSCRLIAALFITCINAPVYAASTGEGSAVRDIVSGIISYTRWPALNGPPILCVFSTSTLSTTLPDDTNSVKNYQTVIVHNEQDALSARCDALYFGTESPERQQQIVNRFQSHPLLTIAEQNAECSIGSAFCLQRHEERVTFSVNLDALSRSGVRVNPDVLMLARNKKHE